MIRPLRCPTALISVLAVLAGFLPASAASAPSGARIEGRLLGSDGRPLPGYDVVLVEADGQPVAASTTSDSGLYSFPRVEAGRYAMGIRSPEGSIAPVAAAPVRVSAGQLVRRDVALVGSDPARVGEAAVDYGLGTWWVSRTPAEKTWTVVGVVGGLVALFFLLEDNGGNNEESVASAVQP